MRYRYLAVNYERSEFTVAQASFPPGNNERDIVVYHHRSKSRLSKAAIAGICVGAIAAVAIIVGRLAWLWHRRRRAKQRRWGTVRLPSLGGTTVNDKSDDLRGWLKPLEGDLYKTDDIKPELDATATARSVSNPHRHELCADEGDILAASKQSLALKDSDHSPPVELDGAETLVGRPSPAVSPLQSSEVSLTPLPMGYPSPQGQPSSPTRGRRPSLGRLKSFFHELQSTSGNHNAPAEQRDAGSETTENQSEVGGEKSLPKEARLEK